MKRLCSLLEYRTPGGFLFAASLLVIALSGISTAPAGALQDSAEKPPSRPANARFGDIYVTGMAALLPGGGTLEPPGSAPKVSAKTLRSELLIPSGSLVTTGASETARIRLGERSLLRLSPDSAVRIYALHLKLERGEIGVQQGKTILPLRILASSSAMIVDCESTADFFLSQAGSVIVTVQAGTTRLQGSDQRFSAGQRIEVSGGTAIADPPASHLLEWLNYPRFEPRQETINRLGTEMLDETFSPAEPPDAPTMLEPVLSDFEHQDNPGQTAPATDFTPSGPLPQTPDGILQQHDLDEDGQP